MKANNKKTILVPWDFTEVAENAMLHAVRIACKLKSDVTLLHIAKGEKEVPEMQAKLEVVALEQSKKQNIQINALTRAGSIFNEIREVGEEIGAMLIVMGTHGIKGMQKLTGSWALKVIANSAVPFIVVQGKPEKDLMTKIVVPVDFSVENKEKLRWADYIGKNFQSKMLLFIPYITDEALLRKTRANLTFARKYLEERGIEHEIVASQNKGKFSDQTVAYASEIQADLIMIMTTRDPGLTDYIFGADEQQIIANNARIPVMCINPRIDLHRLQGFHG